MKQRIGWKQRLLSAVLAVAMCVAMLPAQAVAFAEDGPGPGGSSAAQPGQPASSDKSSGAAEQPSAPDGGAGAPSPGEESGSLAPSGSSSSSGGPASDEGGSGTDASADVSVSWRPEEGAEPVPAGSVGTVSFSARLGGGTAKAEVSVALDAHEAAALREFRSGTGELADGATLEAGGVVLTLELSGQGGAVIRFQLDETHPSVQQRFTFQVPNGVSAPCSIEVGGQDISVSIEGKPNPVLSLQVQAMEIAAEYRGWQASAEAPQGQLQPTGDGSLPDFEFGFSASSLISGEETGVIYTKEQTALLSLALPEGVSLPEGEVKFENNTVTIGGTAVAVLNGLPEGAVVTPALESGVLALAVARTAPQPQSAEIGEMQLSLAFAGAAFTVAPGFEGGQLALGGTLQNVPAAGELPEPQPLEAAGAQVLPSQQGGSSTGGPGEEMVAVEEWMSRFERILYWVDNNNEMSLRPQAGAPQPVLKFRLDGAGDFVQLTAENMARLGLRAMPEAVISPAGVGSYYVTVPGNTLPVKYTHTDSYGDSTQHTVEWQVEPSAWEGYALQKVEEDDLQQFPSANGRAGWYYVLQRDLAFNVRVRKGAMENVAGLEEEIKKHFALTVQVGQSAMEYGLDELGDALSMENGPSMHIYGTWKYNLDGTQITYSIHEAEGQQTGKLEVPGLDAGDYFAITYDNSAAPNFGSITDRLYSGGMLSLTLKGFKTYDSYKVWLDEGVAAGAQSQRPAGEFQLWRYRKGQPSSTAAPVREPDGAIVTIGLVTDEDEQELKFENLEKYDAEGYEYLYVVREYLENVTSAGLPARSYEQVFGRVDAATGSITDRIDRDGELVDITTPETRPAGNTFLYNGGVLSNRITDAVDVTATKIWRASAFQAEFENVTVELALQSRVKDDPEAEWKATGVTQLMDGFFAENLSASVRRSMPRYDAGGQELQYRWVETAVYQGETGENLFVPDGNGGGTFTLQQGGREVHYRSAIRRTGSAEKDYSTTVTNSLADTIDYEVTKVWLDEAGKETQPPQGAAVTFGIYRISSGAALGQPAAVFTLDGTADAAPTVVNEELGISVQETAPWQAVVTPLAEFDEGGGQYQYMLLEQSGAAGFVPTYKTERDEQGYHTTVYNGPGEGNRIMVRKDWVDDSDILHRQEVTVAVYDRKTNEKVNETTLGGGVWHGWVGIGRRAPEDVYILETQVGGVQLPLTEDALNFTQPQAPEEYDGPGDSEYTAIPYETENHRYEATYSHEVLQGVTIYTVANRRFGNIDLTATKTWQDGAGELRAKIAEEAEAGGYSLVLQLEFAQQGVPEYYSITRGQAGGDTVTIGSPKNQVPIVNSENKPVSSRQELDLGQKEHSYEFYGLPKYDRTGTSVQYTVHELWLNSRGEEVSVSQLPAGLQNLLADYRTAYGEPQYEVSGHHDADKQTQQVTNSLEGTKTATWNKVWRDDAVYQAGERPDIYLDIYQVRHSEGGDPLVSLYQANYKWTYLDEEGTSLAKYWVAEVSGLPKYDEYGYEIIYYATEHTIVDAASFDYLPVQYSVGKPGSLTDIGTELELNEAARPGDALDLSGTIGNDTEARYALRETGTFTNAIYQTVTVQGQKLWASLPTGYPSVDLPVVDFVLHRRLAHEDESQAREVARMRVEDWASIYQNGSYLFRLEYEGVNRMEVNGGSVVIEPEPGASPLRKYNEEGELYLYTLQESSITWPGGAPQPGPDLIYADPEINTYLVKNRYESVKGATAVKKFLELPIGQNGQPEAFPAVTFVLTRVYQANGGLSEPETVQRLTWSSAQVREAYEKAQDKSAPLEVTLRFENLDIYAPNGAEYQYAITEDKTYLSGYDTWGMPGEGTPESVRENPYKDQASVPGVRVTWNEENGRGDTAAEVAVGATFLNAPGERRELVELSGEKRWYDYSNEFNTRPNDLTLTVSRYANAQPGQGNAIEREEMPAGSYSVVWDEGSKAGDTWRYSIKGLQEGELERYAPNGMPWRYEVTETLPEGSLYTMSPGTVAQQGSKEGENVLSVTMHPLGNTILTKAPYSKNWVDSSGDVISEDYLGLNLSVTFQLQVAELDGKGGKPAGAWQNADGYFKQKLSGESYNAVFGSYAFTQTKTGHINDSAVWGPKHAFENLPSFLKDGNSVTYLRYRVVETAIEYRGGKQAVTVVGDNPANGTYQYSFGPGLFSPAYWANGKDQPETEHNLYRTQDMYNQLETTEFSVAKQWAGDSSNAYDTRPETGRTGFEWEVSFVIQRSADGGASWENVTVYESGGEQADLTVTLYGTNEQNYASARVAGLPKTDNGGQAYQYRARELQTGWRQRLQEDRVDTGDILDENAIYHSAYTVTYADGSTAVNTLRPTRIYAEKQWNKSSRPVPVEFALEYLAADGGGYVELARVTVDGKADAAPAQPYYEYEAWKAVWAGLPESMPGSDLSQDGKTQYRVTEKLPAGYVQQGYKEETVQADGTAYSLFLYTNVESTELEVVKQWYGTPSGEQKDVVAGLWRTTGSTESGERVGKDKLSAAAGESGQYMLTLNRAGSWKGRVTGLPKYDEAGNAYTYYARELSVGGLSVKDPGFRFDVSHQDEAGRTTVTNTWLVDVRGVKNWNDGGDAAGLRPEEIVLTLWRMVQGGTPEKVADARPVWTNTDTDSWVYAYFRLPAADENGAKYIYTVEEAPVPGYVGEQTGTRMTNTLTVDIPVTKLWNDSGNSAGIRPASIVVALYANGTEAARVRLSAQGGELLGSEDGTAEAGAPGLWQRIVRGIAGESDAWSYTFTGLPQYDANGDFIQYTVKEPALPDGYGEVVYGGSAKDGFTMENVALGGLRVTKTVEGAQGDRDRAFRFRVTLGDTSVSGVYGGMTFENGVASFALKHGESVQAQGLPGGMGYTVAEQEANADGYVTTQTGESGTIPAGGTAEASFINRKDPPGGGIVKTGDGANPLLYAGLLAASLAGLAGMLVWGRRRKSTPPARK